mgnify:CR=1 FL=1
MITACVLSPGGRPTVSEIEDLHATLPANTIWLDATEASDEERAWLERMVADDVPEDDEMDDIEQSSRFRIGSGGVQILSLFPQDISGDDVHGVNMSLMLRGNLLLTTHEDEISVMRLLRRRIRRSHNPPDTALDILLHLHELKVDKLSDMIEKAYDTLEDTSRGITADDDIEGTLKSLIDLEKSNSLNLQALYDTRRALRFINRSFETQLDNHQKRIIDEILNDIESILPHTQFLANKINFQMAAAMGYTNHKQNKIIKIFSVAAVVFMPPTWIASVYGMNFKRIPELDWAFGYPISIGLMVISAALTYLFFRKKGWL